MALNAASVKTFFKTIFSHHQLVLKHHLFLIVQIGFDWILELRIFLSRRYTEFHFLQFITVWPETLEIVLLPFWRKLWQYLRSMKNESSKISTALLIKFKLYKKVVCAFVWGVVEEGAHCPFLLSIKKVWTLIDVSIVIPYVDTTFIRIF